MQCSCVNCLFETILVDNLLQIVQSFFIVGWKPILYWLFGPKNQSFQNKSGKTQPIRTKFGIHGYLKGWEHSGFWAQLVHFGQNGGWDESRRMQVFFCVVIETTCRQLRNGQFLTNLATKRISVSRRWLRKTFSKIFTLGVICPQNLKSTICQTGTSLRAGYRSRDALQRYTAKGQGVSEVGLLFCTTYGCGATGRQSCQIFGFWPIFPIQNP